MDRAGVRGDQEGGVIREQGGQRVHNTVAVQEVPLHRDERPIDPFQSWVNSFVTPCEEVTVQVHFL
jgi:hypothetical protein